MAAQASARAKTALTTGKGGQATGNRIIVGVDGSEHSNYACQWFFQNVWSPEDYVILLNCPDQHDLDKSMWAGGSGNFSFDLELVDQKLDVGAHHVYHELEKFREILVKQKARGKVKAVSAKNPGDAILKTSEEERADIIVVGCKGRGTIMRAVLGTVSDYVVQHSTVPVMVCRYKTSRRKSSTVVPPSPSELYHVTGH